MSAPTRCTRVGALIIAAVCSLVMCLSACAVGPKYKGPVVDIPPTYRGLTQEQTAQNDSSSIGDEKWWSVFQDKVLQDLIRTALAKNYDIRIAASRVLQAQAQLGITRADQFPAVNAGGNITSQASPTIGPIPSYQITLGQVNASASWIPDFWGRYRRATEAARAELLSSRWAQQAVASTPPPPPSRRISQLQAARNRLLVQSRSKIAPR